MDHATNPDKQGKYESLIIIEIGLNPDKNSASIIRGKIKKYDFKGQRIGDSWINLLFI